MESSTLDAFYRTDVLYAQVQQSLQLDDLEAAQDPKALKEANRLLDGKRASAAGDDGESGQLLGVTPMLMHRSAGLADNRAVKRHREAARHALLPRVEDNLRNKCADICEVILPELFDRARHASSTVESSALSLTAASLGRQVMEIPALIVELQSAKNQHAAHTTHLNVQLHTQLRTDLDRIKAMIATLQTLISQYKQLDAPRVLYAKIEWLSAYCMAMGVRAKVLAKQLQVETYPRDRIAILSGVHDALEERRRRALEEHEQLETKLHLYRNADSEYQAIACEYAHVLKGIEEKRQWIQSLNM